MCVFCGGTSVTFERRHQLRLWNGSLSFQYWQKPGVVRLTKVYIFNVTNAENFLNFQEKPKLQEVGPFIYKEDMEKVNIVFHDNGTVTYQHKKILQFMPEMSKDSDLQVLVPNIPLLTLSTQSKSLPRLLTMGLSMFLSGMDMKPFVPVTAQELVFGYDDPLVSIAYRFFPKTRRPMSQMGLLLGRNGTLEEVSTIYTGHTDMKEFGLINRLNGLDRLPYWPDAPCNSIRASEGSFFPPRDKTNEDIVNVWDKDLCRVLPLKYRGPSSKTGIRADLYTPADTVFDPPSEETPDNECFCPDDPGNCPPRGLQNISPCQYKTGSAGRGQGARPAESQGRAPAGHQRRGQLLGHRVPDHVAGGGHRRAHAADQALGVPGDDVRRHRRALHHLRPHSSRPGQHRVRRLQGLQQRRAGARGHRARQAHDTPRLLVHRQRPAQAHDEPRLVRAAADRGPRGRGQAPGAQGLHEGRAGLQLLIVVLLEISSLPPLLISDPPLPLNRRCKTAAQNSRVWPTDISLSDILAVGRLVPREASVDSSVIKYLDCASASSFAAHDSTVMPFLTGLKIKNAPQLAEYGSAVITEKLRDKEGKAFVRLSMGLPLPDWCSEETLRALEELASLAFKSLSMSNPLAKMSAGPVSNVLLKNIQKHEKQSDERKIFLYGCHDSTLGRLLGALKISNNPGFPEFASAVITETLRDDDGKKYVRAKASDCVGQRRLDVLRETKPFDAMRQAGEYFLGSRNGVYGIRRDSYDIIVLLTNDHQAIVFEIEDDGASSGPSTRRSYRWNARTLDVDRFSAVVSGASVAPGTAEDMASSLMSVITGACDASMSKANPRRRREPVHWWTAEIADLRRSCQRARRLFQRSRGRHDEETHSANYASARRLLRVSIKTSKRRCWRQLCDEVDNDVWGKPYKVAMSRLGCPQAKQPSSPLLVRGAVAVLFPRVPSGPARRLPRRAEEPIPAVTLEELKRAQSRIKERSAPGPDGIPNSALKIAVAARPDIFLRVYTTCLETGVFPSSWKRQRLVLLPKPGKPPDEPSSYRPLCMLDTAGKILERIICDRLEAFTERPGGLSERQYGFRKGDQR
ncbi:unnamed protein product [Trichogramma brassicae]|uniref:Reverse transcriptase domain-containing protein n=1 Tax=Trichogramma brassicae TaxID=86971 RepID=A0A6H5I0J6_9HYME|nr:unnamed protein product [Trichogramma brassicae]